MRSRRRSIGDGLEDLLLFDWCDVHEAGDQVGHCRCRGHALHGVDQFCGGLRQQLQDFERLIAQMQEPSVDLGALLLGFGDALDPRDEERIAIEEFGDAKAPLALADHVMATVGTCHVAQQVGFGADAVQIDGCWIDQRGLALQDEPDRPA